MNTPLSIPAWPHAPAWAPHTYLCGLRLGRLHRQTAGRWGRAGADGQAPVPRPWLGLRRLSRPHPGHSSPGNPESVRPSWGRGPDASAPTPPPPRPRPRLCLASAAAGPAGSCARAAATRRPFLQKPEIILHQGPRQAAGAWTSLAPSWAPAMRARQVARREDRQLTGAWRAQGRGGRHGGRRAHRRLFNVTSKMGSICPTQQRSEGKTDSWGRAGGGGGLDGGCREMVRR